ncbi:V-type ATP synthase subunit C [Peptoniphilus sp. MSJ-1]|uniref:V-type ATP synthase subunit C n=1 Tax=Peptoniphilus ovalis TaxID=2841503 RepID=A0ABS6FLP3_9FIRM|nr:V-type ATP synthase subunit C [Peptoniphilus ovalis]MBU5670156.1 V-type ATP synthase subunit C [Peptoniphilus ovalis]
MDRSKFIQSSARVRVLEKKLLSKEVFNRLAEAETLEDALRSLSDTVYNEYINKLESPTEYEKILTAEIERFYKEIYEISPSDLPVDLVTLKYFFHNLRVVLKEDVLNSDLSHLIMNIKDFDLKKYREGYSDSTITHGYFGILDQAAKLYEEEKNPPIIDIYLDNKYLEELSIIANETDSDLFKGYVKDLIDFTNIRTLLRAKNQERDHDFLERIIIDGGNISVSTFLELFTIEINPDMKVFKKLNIYKYIREGLERYKKVGRVSDFERDLDNYFLDLIEDVKYMTYGPEVIFAYCLRKEMEIKNLRIIFVSKLNGLDSEFIRGKLRGNYV